MRKWSPFHIPNLRKLGLANLHPFEACSAVEEPIGLCTRLKEQSAGKDTSERTLGNDGFAYSKTISKLLVKTDFLKN